MKSLFRIIIGVALIAVIGYSLQGTLAGRVPALKPYLAEATGFFRWAVAEGWETFAPCKRPITYMLGRFDDRFGISRDYYLSALAEAEAIWEDPSSRNLFAFATGTGVVKVNLIYDYRQEATT
jgi:hypothetical protein